MSAHAAGMAPTTVDARIHITRRTARWVERPATIADALDFWSFAAGAANVVMQLSWPGVGHGVVDRKVESGNLMKHPWKRARTTFSYLAVTILGSPGDRAAYRDAVDGAHRYVRSEPGSPVPYNAFDRDLQMWLAACLFVGLEDTYQLLRGKLTDELAEQFYRSAFTLGTTLINLRMVTVLLHPVFVPLLRFLTVGFLAPVFREALQVEWTSGQQRRFEYLFLVVAFVNRFLPKFIRQGGTYLLLADVRRRIRHRRNLI
jgi:uncharacterized protein (DUF2236 family)